MANVSLNSKFLLRNDTAANWTSANPVLGKGEMGIEIDTGKFKFGDGVAQWSALAYASTQTALVRSTSPTDSDTGYDVGTVWVNSSTHHCYLYMGLADGKGIWNQVATPKDFDSLSITVTGDVEAASTSFVNGSITLNTALKNVVAAGTYTKITVNEKGLVTGFETLSADDVSGLGTAAKLNSGKDAGNVVVVSADGKIDTTLLPAIAITEPFAVENEAAMLALEAQTGDIAIRADISKCYILKQAPATALDNWLELKVPSSSVLSVNGETGAVSLDADDIPEGTSNLYYTDARSTANFNTNFALKSVADLSDGADVVTRGDVLTLDGGNAGGSAAV